MDQTSADFADQASPPLADPIEQLADLVGQLQQNPLLPRPLREGLPLLVTAMRRQREDIIVLRAALDARTV
jgi:hypothetical protein